MQLLNSAHAANRPGKFPFALHAILLMAIMVVGLSAGASRLCAADWPTYAHDIGRSHATAERLTFPLGETWRFAPRFAPAPAWGAPPAKPTEGILELPRVHFDDAFHAVVAHGSLFFGSSADNMVYCLDANAGTVRWRFTTGGPVRLAPTVADGRVYFGSDDGYAYCLNAADGSLAWRFHAAPTEQRALGHGRMISLWPLRTGVLVDNGVAYLASGVFPAEGVFLYALDAASGKELWRNDSGGEKPQSPISPQGYLLASADRLFVPMGRTSPATYTRADGRFLATAYFGKTIGGTYALLADDAVYTGAEELVAFRNTGKGLDRFAYFDGRKLIITADRAYVATGSRLLAIDRTTYPAASRNLQTARLKLQTAAQTAADVRRDSGKLAREVAELEADQKTADDRQAVAQEILAKQARITALKANAEKLQRGNANLAGEVKRLEAALAQSFRWNTACTADQALILCGDALIVGGKGQVAVFAAASGKALWSAQVDGNVKGLAAADQRLYVSTDVGRVHCFASGASSSPAAPAAAAVHEHAPPTDDLSKRAAAAILRQSGVRKGYCLVLGCEDGRLAVELARQSELMVYAVAADEARLNAARRTVDSAGLYGGRVCVDQFPVDHVPYADYFANLIVSETALAAGQLPPAAETARMLKPCGGVALLGQPKGTAALSEESLEKWLHESGLPGGAIVREDGLWSRLVRGALPGAGNWTHQYGNPGNTACGDDELVRAPLGVLWFGRPGPERMVSRHQRAPAPLVVDGRMIVMGEDWLMAYDAYNGVPLWERHLPGVLRKAAPLTGSNWAANQRAIFVAMRNACLQLDPATGATVHTYPLPGGQDDGPSRAWGYLACNESAVFGSRFAPGKGNFSDAVFSYSLGESKPRWVFASAKIPINTLALCDERLLLVDDQLDAQTRAAAAADASTRRSASQPLPDVSKPPRRPAKQKPIIRRLAALDAHTGQPLWQRPIDLTGCDENPAVMAQGDTLIAFGIFTDGHYWKQFFAGDFAQRRATAYATADGRELWSQPVGFRVRPLIVGDTFHAEPWAFDLKTGAPRTRVNPITGQSEIWQFARPGHHCGCPNAAPHCLFFRSFTLGYYDLDGDFGTMHFGAQRPGCWINFIPAAGLLLMPEASSGCMCPFPNVCTVVFQPRKEQKGFAYYSAAGETTPVRRLALNFGAAGDRHDEHGNLWLGVPRPTGSLVMPLKLDVQFAAGGGYASRSSAYYPAQPAWLFASCVRNVSRCDIPVLKQGDGRCRFDLKLAFCDPDNGQPGQRVFDVKVQGRVVISNCDIVRETGGRDRPLWKEIPGVEADENIVLEFTAKTKGPKPEAAPILQGLEIVRREVLSLGCQAPTVTLNSLAPSAVAPLQLGNLRDQPFVGSLRLGATPGLQVAPRESPLRIASGERTKFELRVAAAANLPAGVYSIPLRLVRADGGLELEQPLRVEHLGRRARMVIPVAEDASISRRYPEQNKGSATVLLVDGGEQKMNDIGHSVALLKFRLKVPGKPVSARLRIQNAGNPTADSGVVRLVEEPWSEEDVTYNLRPKLGAVAAKLGAVASRETIERPLKVDLTGKDELNLAIDPTSTDGVDFDARESKHGAELIVEYELP